jgi:hypothetical protein
MTFFLQPIFVLKKQARKIVFFSNYEWFFVAKFHPILQNKNKKLKEKKNIAQCSYLQSTTNLAALLATIMSLLVGYLSSSATF